MTRMHAEELAVDEGVVRRLLAEQFPRWAGLPLSRVESPGTVNAIFRLGDDLAVRVPFWTGDAGIEREAEWSPRLGPRLPVRIPRIAGVGRPGAGYPGAWLVVDWIPGATPDPGGFTDVVPLAAFIRALRALDATDAPPSHRRGVLLDHDAGVRDAIARIPELDASALLRVWEDAVAAPAWDGPPVWVHADLLPANVLVDDAGRLAAVIDFVPGAGDPAAELLAAWALVDRTHRPTFRRELGADDDAWRRGRGWALLQAVAALPYYRETNPAMARMARHSLRELLEG